MAGMEYEEHKHGYDLDVEMRSSGHSLPRESDGSGGCVSQLQLAPGARSHGSTDASDVHEDLPFDGRTRHPEAGGCGPRRYATPDTYRRQSCLTESADDTPSDFDGDAHWQEEAMRGAAHARQTSSSSCRFSSDEPDCGAASIESAPDPAACDFERFRNRVAPRMAADVNLPLRRAAERLTLQDLWNWYLRPSLFGREVITLGGGSTESRAFFIPFVSAMQLYAYDHVPASRHPGRKRYVLCGKGKCSAAASVEKLSPESSPEHECQVPGWPKDMTLICEHRARQYPWERMPAHNELQHLASQPPSERIPNPGLLMSCPLADLHPCSWFSIAWWPAYRIPDGRLEASFLVFHSLSAVQQQIEHADMRARSLELPVAGALWYKMEGERWLHARQSLGPAAPAGKGGAGGGENYNTAASDSTGATMAHGEAECLPDVDMMYQAHLSELQGTAKRLALGLDVAIFDAAGAPVDVPDHSDFQWFMTRRL